MSETSETSETSPPKKSVLVCPVDKDGNISETNDCVKFSNANNKHSKLLEKACLQLPGASQEQKAENIEKIKQILTGEISRLTDGGKKKVNLNEDAMNKEVENIATRIHDILSNSTSDNGGKQKPVALLTNEPAQEDKTQALANISGQGDEQSVQGDEQSVQGDGTQAQANISELGDGNAKTGGNKSRRKKGGTKHRRKKSRRRKSRRKKSHRRKKLKKRRTRRRR